MLRTTSSNISIITNFGCGNNCFYCIWKKHSLVHCHQSTDWNKVTAFLHANIDSCKVSISGGGDPLYMLKERCGGWWDRLFSITKDLPMLVDVHTKERVYDPEFLCNINKVVLSSSCIRDDEPYIRYILRYVKVRISHVVTEFSNDCLIEDFIYEAERMGFQLTLKELFKHDDKGRYKELKNKYPGIFFLDNGDYNLCYMPDNTITNKYFY